MAGSLVFDPASEDATNVPFELMGPSDDPLVGVTAFSFPAPPLDVQWAGSVDTEGTLPASRKYQNRQINVSLRILDQGLPASTNLVTNPSAEIDLTGIASSGIGLNPGSTVTREVASPYTGSARVKVVTGATISRGVSFALGATLLSGVTYQISLYVMGGAGGESLDMIGLNGAGTVNSATVAFAPTTSWARYSLSWTPVADATSPVFNIRNATATNVTFYVDAVQVVQASALTPYFDGDTPGCAWTGTRHASTSTRAVGAARGAAALRQLQAKVAKVARKGGTLRWTLPTGEIVTFDLHAADTFEPTFDIIYNARRGAYCAVQIGLLGKPYGRLPTEILTSTASTSTPFVTQEIVNVTGDVPGIGRVIVTDTATQHRRHVEYGIEGPLTYDSATSLLIDSDNLVTTGFAGTQTTATGAYDPNASGNSTITCAPAPSLTTAVCGTGVLAHKGLFKVKARVQTTSLTNLFRLAWQFGDGSFSRNPWVSATATGGWVELNLGLISVPVATLGTQKWSGQIEVSGDAVSPGTILIDYLILVPAADGSGVARAPYTYNPGVVLSYDQFTSTTSGGTLNTRSAPLGGAWATSGVATDFTFADAPLGSEETITRATSAEASARFAVIGSAVTNTEAQVQVQTNSAIRGFIAGPVVRWVDASNYIRLSISPGSNGLASLTKIVAGVGTVLGNITLPLGASQALNQWITLRVVAYASGRIIGMAFNATGGLIGSVEGYATDAGIASGKTGIIDMNADGSGATRWFDNFYGSTPAEDSLVIYSGRSMQFRYDDTLRQDSTGTYYGQPKSYEGTRVTIPVGTSRILVKARRNDVEASGVFDDTVTDATQIQIAYTPRVLVVPQ